MLASVPGISIVADANDDGFVNNVEFGGRSPLVDNFESETTQGWRHGSFSTNPPTTRSSGGVNGDDDNYLHFEGHGDGDAVDLSASRLAAFNTAQWTGDYIQQGINELTFDVRNTGTRAIDLRLGIGQSPNSGRWVTPSQQLEVRNDWQSITFSFEPDDLIGLIPGNTDPEADLRSVGVLKFIENAAAVWSSTPAENVPGRTALDVDNFRQSGAGLNESLNAKVTLPADAAVNDILHVNDESSTQQLTLTDEHLNQGEITFSFATPGEANELNLSAFIESDGGQQSPIAFDSVILSTVLPEVSVTLQQDITADDVIDVVEAATDLTIRGFAEGDAELGDLVEVFVNEKTLVSSIVQIDGVLGFEVVVAGSDLAQDADSTIEAVVYVEDSVGNMQLGRSDASYTVDSRPLPGLEVVQSDGQSLVGEDDRVDSFTVALTRQPAADVVVNLSVVDADQLSIDMTSLTFGITNWDSPQVVSLQGVDDVLVDGDVVSVVRLAVDAETSDAEFAAVESIDVSVVVEDNDDRTGLVGASEMIPLYQPSLVLRYIISTVGFVPTVQDDFVSTHQNTVGEVLAFAGSDLPAGFAFADGAFLTISEHPDLFAVIGNAFGGDGITDFALPDLRGRNIIGVDPESGHELGDVVGSSGISLGLQNLPRHAHLLNEPAVGQTLASGMGVAFDIQQPALSLNYLIGVDTSEDETGRVRLFAGTTVPSGWMPAEGQSLSVTQHSELFSVIGTTFGSEGNGEFNLPDLRSRTIVGVGNGAETADRILGEEFGSPMGSLGLSQLPDHVHSYSIGDSTSASGLQQDPLSLAGSSLALEAIVSTSDGTIGFTTAIDVPDGYLPARGQLVDVIGNEGLASTIASDFGGDGITQIGIPDLKGRTIIHADDVEGITRGQTLGLESILINEAQLPEHDHGIGGFVVRETGDSTRVVEAGASDSITIALVNRPDSPVTLTLAISDPQQASLDQNQLIFTADNWSDPQSVTVLSTPDGQEDTEIIVSVEAENSDDGFDQVPSQSIIVDVVPVNDQPTFVAINPPSILEDAGSQTVEGFANFVSGSANESNQSVLEYHISDISDPSFFESAPQIDSMGNLTYTVSEEQNGSVSFTVAVQDDGGIENGGIDISDVQTFVIDVVPVNDPPVLSAQNPPVVDEDSGFHSIPFFASFSPGPIDESEQLLSGYSVSSVSNPSLFAIQPALDSSGRLTYTLVVNAAGTSTFDVTARDTGGVENGGLDTSAARQFTITVAEVNDQPFLSAPSPPPVDQNAGPQTVLGFATFTPGPSSETNQSVLRYDITSISNPDLFEVLPAVDSFGTLTYTPNINQSGTASFLLAVQDDGGTQNGGVDTSAVQTVQITTRPVQHYDYGDAADPDYKTLRRNDGPRHFVSSLFLGEEVDEEADATIDGAAAGDGSDDDGLAQTISIASFSQQTVTTSFVVTASEAGLLDAWIDFNGNGNFDHPAEHLGSGTSQSVVAGKNLIAFDVPAGAIIGQTLARLRVSSNGGLFPTGLAANGEVEDHAIEIIDSTTSEITASISAGGSVFLSSDSGGLQISNELGQIAGLPESSALPIRIGGTDGDETIQVQGFDSGSGQIVIDAGVGFDVLELIGAEQLLDLGTFELSESVEQIDIRGDGPNQLLFKANSLQSTTGSQPIEILLDPDDSLTDQDGAFTISQTFSAGGVFTVVADAGETTLHLLGSGWTHPLSILDVNNSQGVSPLDALVVINELNNRLFSEDSNSLLDDPASQAEFPLKFFDTSGDGRATPLDALRVLNFLNHQGEGTEGEQPAVPVLSLANTEIDRHEDDESVRDWLFGRLF